MNGVSTKESDTDLKFRRKLYAERILRWSVPITHLLLYYGLTPQFKTKVMSTFQLQMGQRRAGSNADARPKDYHKIKAIIQSLTLLEPAQDTIFRNNVRDLSKLPAKGSTRALMTQMRDEVPRFLHLLLGVDHSYSRTNATKRWSMADMHAAAQRFILSSRLGDGSITPAAIAILRAAKFLFVHDPRTLIDEGDTDGDSSDGEDGSTSDSDSAATAESKTQLDAAADMSPTDGDLDDVAVPAVGGQPEQLDEDMRYREIDLYRAIDDETCAKTDQLIHSCALRSAARLDRTDPLPRHESHQRTTSQPQPSRFAPAVNVAYTNEANTPSPAKRQRRRGGTKSRAKAAAKSAAAAVMATAAERVCYNCQKTGHIASECSAPRKSRAPVPRAHLAKQDCRNYLAGRCRLGDTCYRRHVGDVVQHPPSSRSELAGDGRH